MSSHFANQYGVFHITDEFVEMLGSANGPTEQKQFVWECLCHANSPYELINYVVVKWQPELDESCPDLGVMVTDLIVKNQDQWDEDEVACFLLEVLFDYEDPPVDAETLIQLNNPDMIRLPYAGAKLWDAYWEGINTDVLRRLFEHYKWSDYVVQQLDSLADQCTNDLCESLKYRATAEMVRQGIISMSPATDAQDYGEGIAYLRNQQYANAIEPLISFHTRFPCVFPVEVCLGIAKCQMAIDRPPLALEWADKVLSIDPENPQAQQLRIDILAPHTFSTLQIEIEICQPHWTSDCRDVFAETELIFRKHGQIGYDYGAIMNGFGRAVEIQLRQAVLPQIRELVAAHGSIDKNERRFLKCGYSGGDRIRSNDPDRDFTLGKWTRIFAIDERFCSLEKRECFYYYATRYNESKIGYYEWARKFQRFGIELRKLSQVRNAGSHELARKWAHVTEARKLCLELLNDMPALLGNLHQRSQRSDSQHAFE